MLPQSAGLSWTISPNNRVLPGEDAAAARAALWGIKEFWKLSAYFEVVGSGDGDAGAFDEADRWTDPDALHAWIVLRAAGMGGADLYLAVRGERVVIAFSPKRYQLVEGLVWARDEVVVHDGELDVQDLVGERIWSASAAADGSACWFFLAKGRSVHRLVLIQACTSIVEAPATFDPPIIGLSLDNRGLEAQGFAGRALGRAWINDLVCPLFVGGESYGGAMLAVDAQSSPCELQGGGYLAQPLSLWSETPGARGRVGELVDVWACPSVIPDGTPLPDDGSLGMIAVGQLILPWDGLTPPVVV